MEIVLIRHGRPEAAINQKVDALGYLAWIKEYNRSLVVDGPSDVPVSLHRYAKVFAVSSDLPRAIHSAELVLGRGPDAQLASLCEVDIPVYRLPFTLNTYTWLYLNRGLWLLGCKGQFESLSSAKGRAEAAAEQLIDLARVHDQVVVFGHGLMNRFIRIALRNRGWRVESKSNQYWGETHLHSNW